MRQFESAIINAGLPLRKPRFAQEFFHSTDAVVGRSYPTQTVLRDINKAIPQWTENKRADYREAIDVYPMAAGILHRYGINLGAGATRCNTICLLLHSFSL